MNIEVISIPGYPNHQPAVKQLKALLRSKAVGADVREIPLNNESDAEALGLASSATERVNGKNVELLTTLRGSISCRTYAEGMGMPPETVLKHAIGPAKQEESLR